MLQLLKKLKKWWNVVLLKFIMILCRFRCDQFNYLTTLCWSISIAVMLFNLLNIGLLIFIFLLFFYFLYLLCTGARLCNSCQLFYLSLTATNAMRNWIIHATIVWQSIEIEIDAVDISMPQFCDLPSEILWLPFFGFRCL